MLLLIKKVSRVHIALIGLFVIALLGAVGTAYFYFKYQTLEKNPNSVQQAEVTALVKQVGQLILLPNETPTVATVEDLSALKSQPFFANAADGDKVLVFVNSREAILYRPSENKIINVAPLYYQNNQATPQEQAAVSSDSSTTPASSKNSKATGSIIRQ